MAETNVDNGVLTATLKSRKRRAGPRGNSTWKTHFWVASTKERMIMLFKNDQALRPKVVVHVTDIANVSVSNDKKNKFFHLMIRLRNDVEREVKLSSREQRDRWITFMLDMLRSVKADDRIHSVMSVVRQLTNEWSDEFDVKFEANIGQIASLPVDMYTTYINGLMCGADLVRRVVVALPAHLNRTAVTHIRLAVFLHNYPAPTLSHSRDTRYDPQAQSLHIAVHGSPDATTGEYVFKTVEVHAVLSMVGSTVWRTPELEDFLREGTAAKVEADRIAKMLNLQKFEVTLQWGHDLTDKHDPVRVKKYVERFVTAKLLRDVYRAFSSVILADMTTNQVMAAATTTSASPLLPPAMVDQPHSMSSHFNRLQPAAECLGRFVRGLGILIDSDAVAFNNRVPALSLRHDMWQDDYLGPAFTLTSRRRNMIKESGGEVAGASFSFDGSISRAVHHGDQPLQNLSAQLQDVVLHVRIAEACRRLEVSSSSELSLHEGCTVAWEALITSVMACAPSVHESRICHLLQDLADIYAKRLHGLRDALTAAGLTEHVRVCLRGWRLSFTAAQADGVPKELGPLGVPGKKSMPLPAVENFTFVDTILVLGGHHTPPPGIISLYSVDRIPGLRIAFPIDNLLPWFLGYCSVPTNLTPFPSRDEADADDGDDDDEEGDYGDIVAVERKIEAKILTDDNVIVQVYDSQEANANMKAGADIIKKGIAAMKEAFPTVSISKHDLAKVLSLTLAKIRHLMQLKLGEHNVQAWLPKQQAIEVLEAYCEYPQSASLVENALANAEANVPIQQDMPLVTNESMASASNTQVVGNQSNIFKENSSPLVNRQPSTSSTPQTHSLPPSASSVSHAPLHTSNSAPQMIPMNPAVPPPDAVMFPRLSWAVLCHLMPAEAVLAMQNRRDILVVGLENTGKSLIINAIKGLHCATFPSVGVLTTIVPFRQLVFGMKELGGRVEVRKNFKYHIRIVGAVHGIMVVVDAAQSATGEVKEFIDEVLEHTTLRALPCLLLVNNTGSDAAKPVDDVVRALKFGKKCAAHRHAWKATGCNITIAQPSQLDKGIVDGLAWLGQTLMPDES
jgi:L-rhamnose mutarotase